MWGARATATYTTGGEEVLEDPALDDLCEAAEADEEYSQAAKVIADKVKMKEVMKMDKHPIKQFRRWAYRLSVIENKKGTRLLLLDATRIVVPEALREQLVIQAHIGHQGINKMCMDVAAKYFWPQYKPALQRFVPAATHASSTARRNKPSRCVWPWSMLPDLCLQWASIYLPGREASIW